MMVMLQSCSLSISQTKCHCLLVPCSHCLETHMVYFNTSLSQNFIPSHYSPVYYYYYFIFIFSETRSPSVAQAGLELLLASNDPLTSASPNPGIPGVSHHTRPSYNVLFDCLVPLSLFPSNPYSFKQNCILSFSVLSCCILTIFLNNFLP